MMGTRTSCQTFVRLEPEWKWSFMGRAESYSGDDSWRRHSRCGRGERCEIGEIDEGWRASLQCHIQQSVVCDWLR